MLILPALQARLGIASRLLYRLHLLNLDVAAGAVLGNLMVRHLLQTPAYSVASFYILGSTVFLIYTADRLWDVRRMRTHAMTPRHQFHYRNRKLLWFTVAVVTLLTAGAALYFLPFRVIWFGLALALFVGFYLACVHLLGAHRGFQKEPLVAFLYTAGVWGNVIVMKGSLSSVEWTLCLVFAAIAFQNLLLFSWFDLENDLNRQESSLATHWGDAPTQRVLNALFVIIVLISAGVLLGLAQNGRQRAVAGVEALMSVGLFLISRYPAHVKRGERYRWLGDGIFFLPMLVLL